MHSEPIDAKLESCKGPCINLKVSHRPSNNRRHWGTFYVSRDFRRLDVVEIDVPGEILFVAYFARPF